MSDDIPQLLEESLPDHYSEHSIQEIPTVDYKGDVVNDGGEQEEGEGEGGGQEGDLVNANEEETHQGAGDEKENSTLLENKENKKEKRKFSLSKVFNKTKASLLKSPKDKKHEGTVEEDLVLENRQVEEKKKKEEKEKKKEEKEDEEDESGQINEDINEVEDNVAKVEEDKSEKKKKKKKKRKLSNITNKFKQKGKGKQKMEDPEEDMKSEEQSVLVPESEEEPEVEEKEQEEKKEEDLEEKKLVSEEDKPATSEEHKPEEDTPKQLVREDSARAKRKARRQALLEKREQLQSDVTLPDKERPRRRRKKKPPTSPRGLPTPPHFPDDEQPGSSTAPQPEPSPTPQSSPQRDTALQPEPVTPPTPLTVPPLPSGDEVDGGVMIGESKIEEEEKENIPESTSSPGKSTLKKLLPNKKTKGGTKPPSATPTATPSTAPQRARNVELTSAVGVTVHYTEQLYPTLHLTHPIVRVHLIDSNTGLPLPSTLGDPRYQNILPILTCTFDLRQHKTMSPAWEENLLFPESFENVTGCSNAVALFEIVDMVPVRALNKHKSGWSHIAWAFLKLTSGQGGLNIGRKLRLQLYKYPVMEQSIEQLWLGKARSKYPSTLYITLHRVTDQHLLSTLHASHDASRNPALTQYLEQQASETAVKQSEESLSKSSAPIWSRAPGQMCKVPKTLHEKLLCPELGCLLMAFSKDGRRLATGCVGAGSHYPIMIYSIPECKLMYTLAGHHNIIYELSWNKLTLLSASSDCTARTWKNGKQDKVLSHPSFVYCTKWVDKRHVLTGSYDRIIRLWDTNCTGGYGALLSELHGHSGHVNSIVLIDRGTFYSGDSKGQLIEWSGSASQWSLTETINPPEFKGQAISSLLLHPNGRRMFVMTRDSHIRLIDLRIRAVTQRYSGHSNTREHINCTTSPCGSYLFAASEDGAVYTWMVETGDLMHTYKLDLPHSVSNVQYHPHDNYLAIAAFGSAQPILVYKHKPDETLPIVRGVETVSRLEAVKERLLTVSPTKDSLSATQPLNATAGLNITLSPRTKTAQFSTLIPHTGILLSVLHDYTAQRSDEITFCTGERIKLLFKDTDGWWVGENKAGQQGYFPANHVSAPSPYANHPPVYQSLVNQPLNQTLGSSLPSPRPSNASRRLNFDQTMNSTKEWQTFDSDDLGARSPMLLSPGRVSDCESVASSNLSSSRRRHASAKVGAVQRTPQR